MKPIIFIAKAFVSRTFPLLTEWSRLPSFSGWIALSCGIAAQNLAPPGNGLSSILYNEVLLVAIALSLAAALAFSCLPVRFIFFTVAGFVLALHAFENQHAVYGNLMHVLDDRSDAYLSARIESAPALSFGEYCFTVRADSVFTDDHKAVLFNKALTCYSFRKPPVYGTLSARGRFRPPVPAENPGAFDDFANCMSNNIWGRFYIDTVLQSHNEKSFWNTMAEYARSTVVNACSRISNSDYRAIIVASFLNDKSGLSDSIRDLFFKAGIYHLLALSGFNIAILATALFAFMLLIPVGKTVKTVTILICVWSYYIFIGPIPSLFRAVLMTTIVLSAYLFQHKPHALNSLGLAGMLWLILSPASLFTPSYQLSFSATLGLVTMYPVLSGMFMPRRRSAFSKSAKAANWVYRPLCSMLFVSVAAFVATAPVLVFHFGTLSFSGIIANLFAVTLMSIAMWISLIGFFMQIFFPPLVTLCMHTAEFTIALMVRCSAIVAMAPMSAARIPALGPLAYTPYVLFFTGFCTVKPELTKRYFILASPSAFLLSAALVMMQAAAIPPSVTSFCMKKAPLTGIRWPDGRLWLVGTGPEGAAYSTFSRVIVPWMRRNFSYRIDAVVVPGDPCNAVQSLEPLLKNAGVRKIISVSKAPPSCSDFSIFLREFRAGLKTFGPGTNFSQDPLCTCMVIPAVSARNGESFLPVKVGMLGHSVTIPGSLSNEPSRSGGSATFTFSKSHCPSTTHAIPESHPLYGQR